MTKTRTIRRQAFSQLIFFPILDSNFYPCPNLHRESSSVLTRVQTVLLQLEPESKNPLRTSAGEEFLVPDS